MTDINENKNDDEKPKKKHHKTQNSVFQKIIELMNGAQIEMTENEIADAIDISIQLGNGELLSKLKKEEEIIQKNNVIERLTILSQSKITIDDEIEFIAKNFDAFSVEDLSAMNVEIIESILIHQHFVVKSENSLYDKIQTLIKKNNKIKKYDSLLSYIQFEYLSDEKMIEFIEQFNFDDLNIMIWQNLCQRLKLHIDPHLHSKRHIGTEIQYIKEKEFKGIFHYLNKICKGNCLEKNIVTSSMNGAQNHHNLIEYKKQNSYCTSSSDKPFVSFDFQNRAIKLTHYTLKSGGSSNYLIQWEVKGSNDNKNWTIIDSRKSRDLCGNYLNQTFSCDSCESYRYIQITQTGPNSGNSNEMALSNIEFYGHLSNSLE